MAFRFSCVKDNGSNDCFNLILFFNPIELHQDLFIIATSQRSMRDEKLVKAYVCQECRSVFLFLADTEDHERLWGHAQFVTLPLELVAENGK